MCKAFYISLPGFSAHVQCNNAKNSQSVRKQLTKRARLMKRVEVLLCRLAASTMLKEKLTRNTESMTTSAAITARQYVLKHNNA